MSERAQCCGACRHYDGENQTCHRYAPNPTMGRLGEGNDEMQSIPLWPYMLPEEWCGEWAPCPVRQGRGQEGGAEG